MMKFILIIFLLFVSNISEAQISAANPPNDCGEAVPGCTTPSFPIFPPVPATNNVDFGIPSVSTISNPGSNPSAPTSNAGCLLSGETSSTFITISCVSSGTLSWSIQGPTAGCFDWIMWPYTNSAATCTAISNNTLAPVACNWNGACGGYTGMCPPGALPAGASQLDFQNSLTVTAGQQFLLCLSNYSSTSQNVNLNFFGTANVACDVSVPDRIICVGSTTNVTVATPGYTNPQFQWLTTAGVSNPTSGTNVTVTTPVTASYAIAVSQPATATTVALYDTAYFTVFVEDYPTPNAGIDDTVCYGTLNGIVNLNGTDTTGGNRIKWSFEAPTIVPMPSVTYSPNDSSLTPTVTVNQPGVYNFILKETSTVCGIVRDTVQIYVKKMTVEADSIAPSCFGFADGEIWVTGLNASEYSFDNGGTWSANSTLNTFAAGTYTVCARDYNMCTACTSITVVDPDPIEIFVSNDTLICENGTANLFATATGDTVFNFDWALFPSAPSYVPNETQYASPIANTWYYVQAGTQSGCFSPMDSIYVTMRLPISGTISADATICPGYPTTLNATAQDGFGAPYTFSWSSGDTGTGTQYGPTVSPLSTQGYTVTITDNCESTPLVLSNTVVVAPEPVPSFTVDINEQCEPAVFTLNTTTDTATFETASWIISDGQFYTNQDTVVTDEMLFGSYNVELILVNEFGCIDSVTYPNYIISHALPKAAYKFSPGQPTMFNTSVTFSNYSVGADLNQWTFELGNPGASNQENPVVVFPDGYTGLYEVNLIVTSDFGCKDSISGLVEVFPEVLLFAPNSFTPDGDEYNPTWKIHIEGIDLYDFNLEVRDRWGQLVWQSKDVNGEWDGTFNNKIVQSGIYTWIIKAKDVANDKSRTFNGSVMILR
ncbi:MAG: gliding motility-associated C-terminal domain-containing protein [Bacteroidota bacterium]